MNTETRERFPITDEAVQADLGVRLCWDCQAKDIYDRSPEACQECARLRVTAAASHIVAAWIDGLTLTELLELRHAGYDWDAKMRASLRKLAEEPK